MFFLQIHPHLLDRSGPQGVLASDHITLHQHKCHIKDMVSPVSQISNMYYANGYYIRMVEALHLHIPVISFQTLEVSDTLRMTEPPLVEMTRFLHIKVRSSI